MSDSVRILSRRVVTDTAGVERLLIGETPLPDGWTEGAPPRVPNRDDAGRVQVLARSEHRVAQQDGEATEAVVTDASTAPAPAPAGGEAVDVDEPEGERPVAPVEPPADDDSDGEPAAARRAQRRSGGRGQGSKS